MRSKLLILFFASLFLSGCAAGHLQLVSLSDGTSILGEFQKGNHSVKITMPDGETLRGSYSALTNSYIGSGSLFYPAKTMMPMSPASDGASEAYALLRGDKGTVMEMVLRYSELTGSGYGVASTNRGTGYRIVFPVSKESVAATGHEVSEGVGKGKSGKDGSDKKVGAGGIGVDASKESTGTGDPKALAWLGKSYLAFQRKDWTEVIKSASAAIENDPTLEGAYLNRAWAFYKQGLFDQSIKDCSVVIRANPENVLAYNYRGLSYAEKGLSDPAMKDLDEAAELDGKNPVTLNNRGVVFERKGDRAEALRDYKMSCEFGFKVACENLKKLSKTGN